ncbi:MAG: Glutaredoxin [Microbacterium sp.]|nr:Glutaredoxin [Microbacterium sp.]
MSTLHIYSTDPCTRCVFVKRWLDARSIPYTETNMAHLPAAEADEIRAALAKDGYMGAPTVYFTDDDADFRLSFTGADMTKLEEIEAHLNAQAVTA